LVPLDYTRTVFPFKGDETPQTEENRGIKFHWRGNVKTTEMKAPFTNTEQGNSKGKGRYLSSKEDSKEGFTYGFAPVGGENSKGYVEEKLHEGVDLQNYPLRRIPLRQTGRVPHIEEEKSDPPQEEEYQLWEGRRR